MIELDLSKCCKKRARRQELLKTWRRRGTFRAGILIMLDRTRFCVKVEGLISRREFFLSIESKRMGEIEIESLVYKTEKKVTPWFLRTSSCSVMLIQHDANSTLWLLHSITTTIKPCGFSAVNIDYELCVLPSIFSPSLFLLLLFLLLLSPLFHLISVCLNL